MFDCDKDRISLDNVFNDLHRNAVTYEAVTYE